MVDGDSQVQRKEIRTQVRSWRADNQPQKHRIAILSLPTRDQGLRSTQWKPRPQGTACRDQRARRVHCRVDRVAQHPATLGVDVRCIQGGTRDSLQQPWERPGYHGIRRKKIMDNRFLQTTLHAGPSLAERFVSPLKSISDLITPRARIRMRTSAYVDKVQRIIRDIHTDDTLPAMITARKASVMIDWEDRTLVGCRLGGTTDATTNS